MCGQLERTEMLSIPLSQRFDFAQRMDDIDLLRQWLMSLSCCSTAAHINEVDAVGMTALHHACTNCDSGDMNKFTVLKLLVDFGGDLHAKDAQGRTPLQVRLESSTFGSDQIVDLLLRRGSVVTVLDCDGNTLLHTIAKHNFNADWVSQLCARGCPLNARNRLGETALQLSMLHPELHALKALVSAGCDDINFQDDQSSTPLHRAIENGCHGTFEALLQRGAECNVSLADNQHRTPLHLAAAVSVRMVQQLLRRQADCSVVDLLNHSPFHVACAARRPVIAELLLGRGGDADRSSHAFASLNLEARSIEVQVRSRLLMPDRQLTVWVDPKYTLCDVKDAVELSSFEEHDFRLLAAGCEFNLDPRTTVEELLKKRSDARLSLELVPSSHSVRRRMLS